METQQVMDQTVEQDVYEPPILADIGQFGELTADGGLDLADYTAQAQADG